MSTIYLEPVSIRITSIRRMPLCPKCGRSLHEVDRVVEKGSLYLWYECSGPECEDRWFEKEPAKVG
jgi:hypothetical protein